MTWTILVEKVREIIVTVLALVFLLVHRFLLLLHGVHLLLDQVLVEGRCLLGVAARLMRLSLVLSATHDLELFLLERIINYCGLLFLWK